MFSSFLMRFTEEVNITVPVPDGNVWPGSYTCITFPGSDLVMEPSSLELMIYCCLLLKEYVGAYGDGDGEDGRNDGNEAEQHIHKDWSRFKKVRGGCYLDLDC